jgi:hypothetical protein
MDESVGPRRNLSHEITREVRRQLDRLDEVALEGDWVQAWVSGDCIDTDIAANIAGTSRQTIRRHAAAARDIGRPIGICVAEVWLISLRRMLRWLERTEGYPARVAAERRAEKLLADRAAPKIGVVERAATV